MSAPTATQTVEQGNRGLARQPCLVVVRGSQRGLAFWLDRPCLLIGREPDCGIFLDDASVSRQHAELSERDRTWWLQDLQSKNGTQVNQRPVAEPIALADGDLLLFGAVGLQFLQVQVQAAGSQHAALESGTLKLDPTARLVWIGAHSAALTETETQLLAALLRRPGRVLSVPVLMRAAWPDASQVATATVTSHMRNLRQKLKPLAGGEDPIRSVYGQGYALQL